MNLNTLKSPHLVYISLILTLLLPITMPGCIPGSKLPSAARDVLEKSVRQYYTSGSGNTTFDQINSITVTRAWQPRENDPATDNTAGSAFWCAELAVSGEWSGQLITISPLWLVTRRDSQSEWLAAAMETISAQVTIDRCK